MENPYLKSPKPSKTTALLAALLMVGLGGAQADESLDGIINSSQLHLPIQNFAEQEFEKDASSLLQQEAMQLEVRQARNNNSSPKPATSRQQAQSTASNADKLLIQGLATSGDFDQIIRNQLGDGLSPEEIQKVKEAFLEYEAARNNPEPPPTRSDIKQLSAGETLDLVVMNDFPSTLMLADQFGEPLAISYHDLGAGSVVEVREMRTQKGDRDVVDGLRIHALQPMRSTSLTIRAEGSRLPINVTIRTIPADGKTSVSVLNELRLAWVNKISQTEVSAGRYAAPDITKRSDKMMMDVVTGTLLSNPEKGVHKVPMDGDVNSALFVDETTGYWYLRLPIDATPQNVAIESQALSSINGYRVIRMKSAPPKVIGVTANGRSHRLVMHLDRRLSHVQ